MIARLFLLPLLCAAQQEPTIEGAEAVSAAEVRGWIERDLARYKETGLETALEDAAFRIAHRYRLRGFVFAAVERKGAAAFRIREGPRVRLGRLDFRGNRAIDSEEMRASMPEPPGGGADFSMRLVGAQTDAIYALYHARGHIDVKVAEPELRFQGAARRMDAVFTVTEGPSYLLAGLEGLPEELEEIAEAVGRPYTPQLRTELEGKILDHYRDRGRPLARASVTPRKDPVAAEVTLRIEIDPGPEARFGGVRIEGRERTAKSFVRRRLGIEAGETYSQARMREAVRRLIDTGVFETVHLTQGEFQEETGELPLRLELKEAAPGEVSLRAGYAALDGPRVGAELGYRNVFGGGELLRLGGTVGTERSHADLEFGKPYLFGTELRLGISGYLEEATLPSFDVRAYGGVPSLTMPISKSVEITIGVRWAAVRTENVEPGVDPGGLLDFDYTAGLLSIGYDDRDSSLLPTRGVSLAATLEWSDRPFDSDVAFFKAAGGVSIVVPLADGWGVAASLDGGVIRPTGETASIPVSLRFFGGGTNTVRGYEFGTLGPKVSGQPTGGEVLAALQTEIRVRVWGDLHAAAFYDRGGVWADHGDVDLSEARSAVGIGLRYLTPAGAIVLDVGRPIRRLPDEDPVEVHVSIGFPF